MSVNWLERLNSIKTNNKITNGFTSYAPNKPLLLLYLISNLYNNNSSLTNWATVNKELGEVLMNYGNKGNVLDPFFRLRTDKLFEVPAIDKSNFTNPQEGGFIAYLNRENPEGFLPKEFEIFLLQADNMSKVIGIILHKYFPMTIHDMVLTDLNLPYTYHLPVMPRSEIRRERAFSKTVLSKYKYRCLFCDYYGVLNKKNVGIDAAHIVMHSRGGSNSIDNGLSLCSLCHRLFDRGALSLDGGFNILVSPFYEGKLNVKINEPIVNPTANMLIHVNWHRREIFNG